MRDAHAKRNESRATGLSVGAATGCDPSCSEEIPGTACSYDGSSCPSEFLQEPVLSEQYPMRYLSPEGMKAVLSLWEGSLDPDSLCPETQIGVWRRLPQLPFPKLLSNQ